MVTALFFDLAYAATVAISPAPIAVVILMLFSAEGRRNALGYLVGWVLGLIILGIVLWGLAQAGFQFLSSISGTGRPLVQIGLGFLIILLGWHEWDKPPKSDAAQATPKWMSKVDNLLTKSSGELTPVRAFFLALVMSALSLKNIALMFAVSIIISNQNLGETQITLLLLVFVVISSVTIGIPTLYAMAKGASAQDTLQQWRTWVMENRGRAFALLMFVFGAIFILNGFITYVEQSS